MFTIWTVLPVSFVTRGKNGNHKPLCEGKKVFKWPAGQFFSALSGLLVDSTKH